MAPRPDELDGPMAELVAELATWRTASAPSPSPALRDLFARSAVLAPPAVVTTRRTPMSESKRLLAAVPAKIAAGVLGALLAGSLGAGAMTGTIALTSQESEVPETTEILGEDEAKEDEVVEDAVVEDAVVEEEVVEEESEESDDLDTEVDEAQDAGDPTTAPVPTSVSEAAQNHQFDEACGNHGAYVSHFARTGEEPECATAARGGAPAPAPEATEAEAADAGDTEAGAPKAKANKASAKGAEKSEAGKAKAAANKAKAPGRATSGR